MTDIQKTRMFLAYLYLKKNIKASELAKMGNLSKTSIYTAINKYKNDIDKPENKIWLEKIINVKDVNENIIFSIVPKS